MQRDYWEKGGEGKKGGGGYALILPMASDLNFILPFLKNGGAMRPIDPNRRIEKEGGGGKAFRPAHGSCSTSCASY